MLMLNEVELKYNHSEASSEDLHSMLMAAALHKFTNLC